MPPIYPGASALQTGTPCTTSAATGIKYLYREGRGRSGCPRLLSVPRPWFCWQLWQPCLGADLCLQSWRRRCPMGPTRAKGRSKTPSSRLWTAVRTPPPSCRTSLSCSDPFLSLRTLWPRARHERWNGSARPRDSRASLPPSAARSRLRPLSKRCPARPLPAHKRAAAAAQHSSHPTPAAFDIRRRCPFPVRSLLTTGTVSRIVGMHARRAHG